MDSELARSLFILRCAMKLSTPRKTLPHYFVVGGKAELNLRSLKTIMQMQHLRCHEPHRVRNEIRSHMLAYNLIRGVMTEAAMEGNVQSWQSSFKATMTTLTEMLPVLGSIGNADGRLRGAAALLLATCGRQPP